MFSLHFNYNFRLALKSLRQRTGLTALMVVTMGIGIGMLMTMLTIGYQAKKVPLPALSKTLYLVQMDSRDAPARAITEQRRMVNLTWQDAINLFNADTVATGQTFNFKVFPILAADDKNTRPIQGMVDATTSSFFKLFQAPFLYGKAWHKSENAAPVIVLSKKTNDSLFGGQNSVGQQISIGTGKATVVGVLDDWAIEKRVFDSSFSIGRFDDAFMPYQFAVDLNLQRSQRMRCHPQITTAQRREFARNDVAGLQNSECTWINFWAQIDQAKDVGSYQQFTEQYVTEQQGYGRFPRPVLNFVTNIEDQVANFGLNSWNERLTLLAYLFFFVCLVNAVGMLLTKFLATSKEVCLRRALGAKKKAIMGQYLIEILLIGLMGGAVGVLVAFVGLQGMKNILMYASDYTADMAVLSYAYRLDWSMISASIAVAIVSTLIVGLYPVWRIVNVSPASQLKGL